jgi:hypothetical protein
MTSTKQFVRSLCIALLLTGALSAHADVPTAAATAAYNNDLARLEGRLGAQHRNAAGFVAGIDSAQQQARLHRGEFSVEQLGFADRDAFSGAMLHHWRGTAFVPGAHAAEFERLLSDFSIYPRIYAPEVVSARTLTRQPGRIDATMRVRQKHILTVVLDTNYAVTFAHLDPLHGTSTAHGTHVAEIASAGTPREHAFSANEQHGFLWRIDTYWSWAERDGGLYIQIESVTLTRGIPHGLGWAVGPFVQSVPRESLEFTLRSTAKALARRN